MKDDLVARLRETWPLIECGPVTRAQRELAHSAADEIERLQARVAELEATVNEWAGV